MKRAQFTLRDLLWLVLVVGLVVGWYRERAISSQQSVQIKNARNQVNELSAVLRAHGWCVPDALDFDTDWIFMYRRN